MLIQAEEGDEPPEDVGRFRKFADRFEVEADPRAGWMIHLGLELGDGFEVTDERIGRWQTILGSGRAERPLYRSDGGMVSNLDQDSTDVGRLRRELKQANRGVLALYEEIREANEELQREIEERKRREEELVRTKEELAEANARLEELSRYDELTGLANRRAFDQELETVWNLSHREEAPLSLAMVDIDHFKEYNDTYGHPAGDEVLERVASALQEVARRASDLVARYGGEEFAVILPQVPEEEAGELGERMRSRVEACGIEHGASSAGDVVTVSVGVATAPDVSRSEGGREELVERADRALYRAKEAGRNRVRR